MGHLEAGPPATAHGDLAAISGQEEEEEEEEEDSPGWSAPMERRLLAACGPRTFLRRWAGGRTIVLFHCRFCPAAPRRYES
ncbi:unnamed protein product [Prorocentrum cordatum]|uniref:Uncharacterized protein n=1 Tax=Prorocentrum cordatum TaxID=2364126 RepID=A0ABN9X3R6_9DINO|nr:unnamed protein product [Polarella glacialis]